MSGQVVADAPTLRLLAALHPERVLGIHVSANALATLPPD
jgi:hypothetical protein